VKKLYFFILPFFTYSTLFAIKPSHDARASSLAGSSVTCNSPFCIEYNAANLAFYPSSIALNAQNQFGIHEYTQILLIGNYSLKESAIGLSYQAENGIITNQKIAVAFAKKIQPKLACGVTINYNQFRSQNQYYQNHQIITFNAGLSYKINPKTLIGFQIENPNRSQETEFILSKNHPCMTTPCSITLIRVFDFMPFFDILLHQTQNFGLNMGTANTIPQSNFLTNNLLSVLV